jgi:hypothetical protein
MFGGIDSQVNQLASTYASDPQRLQQMYAQDQDLLKLLALQKMKSERDATMREMQMSAMAPQGTVAQQLENEMLQATSQDIAKQLGMAVPQGQPPMPPQGQGRPPMPPQGQGRPPMPPQNSGIAQVPAPNMAKGFYGGGVIGLDSPTVMGSTIKDQLDAAIAAGANLNEVLQTLSGSRFYDMALDYLSPYMSLEDTPTSDLLPEDFDIEDSYERLPIEELNPVEPEELEITSLEDIPTDDLLPEDFDIADSYESLSMGQLENSTVEPAKYEDYRKPSQGANNLLNRYYENATSDIRVPFKADAEDAKRSIPQMIGDRVYGRNKIDEMQETVEKGRELYGNDAAAGIALREGLGALRDLPKPLLNRFGESASDFTQGLFYGEVRPDSKPQEEPIVVEETPKADDNTVTEEREVEAKGIDETKVGDTIVKQQGKKTAKEDRDFWQTFQDFALGAEGAKYPNSIGSILAAGGRNVIGEQAKRNTLEAEQALKTFKAKTERMRVAGDLDRLMVEMRRGNQEAIAQYAELKEQAETAYGIAFSQLSDEDQENLRNNPEAAAAHKADWIAKNADFIPAYRRSMVRSIEVEAE